MDNNQMGIDITPEIIQGQYSNLAVITHSQSEFILDFAQMLPGLKKPTVRSRVIMTPEHAKRLLMALADNVNKYEQENGEITVKQAAPVVPPMKFGGEA